MSISKEFHLQYLEQALSIAKKSPPKPTNFRVGALLVSFAENSPPQVLSTGYTLELPGNTHAEQCALSKLASSSSVSESELPWLLPASANVWLYTTLEPCSVRLSGNLPCVSRITRTRDPDCSGGIRHVVFGAREPGTFVQDSQSCTLLSQAGVDWTYLPDYESEILEVAKAGHVQNSGNMSESQPLAGTEAHTNKNSESLGQAGQALQAGVTPNEGHAGAESHENKSGQNAIAAGQTSIVAQEQLQQGEGTNVDNISPEERKRQEGIPRNPKKRMMDVPVDELIGEPQA